MPKTILRLRALRYLPSPEKTDREADPAFTEKLATVMRAAHSPFTDSLVLDFRSTPSIRKYLNNETLETIAASGTVTPAHVIHLKPFPLVIAADASRKHTTAALVTYKARYSAYFKRHAANAVGEKIILDPQLRMILIKDMGLVGLRTKARVSLAILASRVPESSMPPKQSAASSRSMKPNYLTWNIDHLSRPSPEKTDTAVIRFTFGKVTAHAGYCRARIVFYSNISEGFIR